jgi:Na+-transporting methylmalonyl-CoA/oxaloacetate decarboxylase gamma subunit
MKKQQDQQVVSSLIVFAVVIIMILAVSGCSTAVPVTARFPDPPGKGATTACPALQKLNDGAQLSDVANTVTVNYSTYYECAVKTDAWQEWYRIQKHISEGAGK